MTKKRTRRAGPHAVRRFGGQSFARHQSTFKKKATARAWAHTYKKRSARRRARVVREKPGRFAVYTNPCHIGGRGTYTTPAEWRAYYATKKGKATLRRRRKRLR
jgi:hypothetical protein